MPDERLPHDDPPQPPDTWLSLLAKDIRDVADALGVLAAALVALAAAVFEIIRLF